MMALSICAKRVALSTLAGGVLGALYYPSFTERQIHAESRVSVGEPVIQQLSSLSQSNGNIKKENKLIEQEIIEGARIKQDVYGDAFKFWDNANLNYAIVGASGTGKSTFAGTFGGQPYKFKTGFIEHDIKAHVYEKTNKGCQIVFWDIPSFSTSNYVPEEYFDTFGLALFDGIILMTSARFSKKDETFYKAIRKKQMELFRKMTGKSLEHVPVYIVRTKFDVDLESELKRQYHQPAKNKTIYDKIWNFFCGEAIFTHNEFLQIWDNTLTVLENQAKHSFKDVFDIDEKWMSYFYIVSADWDNRMLTTYKNYKNDKLTKGNKHGGEHFGWHGVWRRIWKDTLYFNGKGVQNDRLFQQIDIECDRQFMDYKQPQITDSALYKQYTQRTGGINMTMSTLFAFCGISTFLAYNIGMLDAPAQRDWKQIAGKFLMGGLVVGCFAYQQRLIQERNDTIKKLKQQIYSN
eukprot:1656_1